MSQTIWKFQVELQDTFGVAMPEGAEVLSVQMQDGAPYMWALVDPAAPKSIRRFHVRGTGHPFALADARFIGTFQMRGGALVFHLFEDAR